ncbi:flavodoxin domain-containing protein [Halomarina rubra]|uniref:Flavodoxin domain-containing protein n=1 Tax=Halomarina rubra TaxID=2071873 RepID=A0ABD6ASQ4_9EURY|nr:flavodoxin domain-containing protein [Halomarina rubra]
MASILLVYGTSEGQTERVAHHLAGVFTGHGHTVDLVHGERLPEGLDTAEYDAVVVGDPIHLGRHHGYVRAFVERHRETLNDGYSAFFQLSLSAASDDPEHVAAAEALATEFLDATGWHPDHVASFAGALAYSQYGLLKRVLMRRIARKEGGDTDTSRDYEYTDWDAVTAFAEAIAADLPKLRQT